MTTPITNTMTKNEVLTVWIDALRSGDYHQGQEVLTEIYGSDEYDCCLGVLCKLVNMPSEVTEDVERDAVVRLYTFYSENSTTDFLTDGFGFIQWLDPEKRKTLMTLNDDHVSFDGIAKVLERWRDEDIFDNSVHGTMKWLGMYEPDADEIF